MSISPEEQKLLLVFKNMGYIPTDFKAKWGLVNQLIEEEIVTYEVMSEVLKQYFYIETIDLDNDMPSKEALDLIDSSVAKKHRLVPYKVDEILHVAMSNPFDSIAYGEVRIISDMTYITRYFLNPKKALYYIDYYYKGDMGLSAREDGGGVESLLDLLLSSAVMQRASDIHIEQGGRDAKIRLRVDGNLISHRSLEQNLVPNIISRIKILANLDIADFRVPKDGSFVMPAYPSIDFRVSTIPTIYGEKVVIRIIYKNLVDFRLDGGKLGFSEEDTEIIKRLLSNKTGAILVTGATGSGKSTTLSSFISYLNRENINITTVEDPVEYIIEGVNHVNINTKINVGFSTLLRNILRQDPDIIMIGEIRDLETARIVMEASLTGHLCLSTLHTNDAISTIARLTDMGIEKYLLLEAIKGVISQRLVRRLCVACKVETRIPMWVSQKYGIDANTRIYERGGCDNCQGTGYIGRFAIYEILVIDEGVKRIFMQEEVSAVRDMVLARQKGTLEGRAIEELVRGNTSMEEVYGFIFTPTVKYITAKL